MPRVTRLQEQVRGETDDTAVEAVSKRSRAGRNAQRTPLRASPARFEVRPPVYWGKVASHLRPENLKNI